MDKKKRPIGPVVEIILIAIIISIVSLICKLLGMNGHITDQSTLETTMIAVDNIFSKAGIKHILNDSLVNFKNLEPLILIIMSLISVSIMEASGLLKSVFLPLKKVKPKYITLLVMFVGIISTIIGDYSYALLIPVAGVLYKYIGRDSSLGVITMFVAITVGYGTGLVFNYQAYEIGMITQTAARSVSESYNYNLFSNLYLMITSTIILSIIGTILLEKFAKTYSRNEETDNLNVSKKASRISLAVLIMFILLFVYCIIPGLPGSGIFLNKQHSVYIAQLFGTNSPLKDGLMFIIIGVLMVCGFIYGTVSRNIKNSSDYSNALTKTFEGTGYVFVLLFFTSVLYGVLEWTNLDIVIATNIIEFIGMSKLSGLVLVIVGFVSILLISILLPSTIDKWTMIAPVYVPLFMRANISPEFTQTMFQAADSVGKLFSPIYIYLIVTIGFIYKYNKNTDASIIQTMKKIFSIVFVLTLVWLLIIVTWYLIGIPIGINSTVTL